MEHILIHNKAIPKQERITERLFLKNEANYIVSSNMARILARSSLEISVVASGGRALETAGFPA